MQRSHEHLQPKTGNAYGIAWGLAFGIGLTAFIAITSRSAWTMLVLPVLGPVICLVSVVLCAVVYSILARRFPGLRARRSLYLAVAATVLFVALPLLVFKVYVHRIAYSGLPVFPGGDKIARTIRSGPAARIDMTMHVTATRKEDVLAFYRDALQKNGWAVDSSQHQGDPRFFAYFSARRPGETLLGAFNEQTGQISLNWYRNYSTH